MRSSVLIYPYTAENRLDTPHAYMYSAYGGVDFLVAYFSDRRVRLAKHLRGVSRLPRGKLMDALNAAARDLAAPVRPEAFSPDGTTLLQPLLAALLGVLAAGEFMAAQTWLGRIIQRFEVSKKLYAAYTPGFRKGEGDVQEPARYVELALCLSLAYALSGKLQYLSTLLKLVDLLLSLDPHMLRPACSSERLALLVAVELDAVATLAEKQRVIIDAA